MNKIKNFVPAVIVDFVKYLMRKEPIVLGNYSSYENARANSSDYYDEEIINNAYTKASIFTNQLQSVKTLTFSEFDMEVLASLSIVRSSGNEIKVLDYGGAFGKYFYLVKKIFGDKCNLLWDIYETKDLCFTASKKKYNESIRYLYNTNELRINYYNLIIVNSSLQYFVNPLESLNQLISLKSQVLLINRIPLSNRKYNHFAIQKFNLKHNGPTFIDNEKKVKKIPICILCRNDVMNLLKNNYSLLLEKKSESSYLAYKWKRLYMFSMIAINFSNEDL